MKSLVDHRAHSGQAERGESGVSHGTQWPGLAWGVWWITGHTVVRLMEEGK